MYVEIIVSPHIHCPTELPPLTLFKVNERPEKAWPKAPPGYPLGAMIYHQSADGWQPFRVVGRGKTRRLKPKADGVYFGSWQAAKACCLDAEPSNETILLHNNGQVSIRDNDQSPFRNLRD